MSEKRRVLICRFREHVHTQESGEVSRGIERVQGGIQRAGGEWGIRDRERDGEHEARTCAHTACVCPGAVCHAHSCDLQLMKLGCSRVACQINMSPTSAPLSVVQSLPPTDYLPSSPSSFSTPALPRRFSSPFFVNLPHTTTDVALPLHTLTLSRAAPPLPVPHPFRLQDGLIRNKIIVLFARTCF